MAMWGRWSNQVLLFFTFDWHNWRIVSVKLAKNTIFPRLRFPHGWYELWKFSFLFFMHVSRNMPTEHAVEKSWEKDKPATEILPSKMHPKAVFDEVWLPSDDFLHHRKRLTGITGCASAIQRTLVAGNCDLLYSFELKARGWCQPPWLGFGESWQATSQKKHFDDQTAVFLATPESFKVVHFVVFLLYLGKTCGNTRFPFASKCVI